MKKLYILLLFLCFFGKTYAQDLYDINTIQTIEIVFEDGLDWDAILDAQKAGDNDYTEAASVTINGETFYQVGVKYKGNSSYNANQTKNPFHIELDTYVNQDYNGYTDIKLSNVIFDPTFIRETVAYNIVGQYMDAPEANYANVYVNGTLLGIYTNVESISKKFVEKHFGSKNNAFFNCSPPDGAGPTSTNLPNLAYIDNNSSSYDDAYEIKSDDEDDVTVAEAHWDNLIELTNILDSDIDNIETILNVDSVLWMLALDNAMVNLDSYIGQFKQNYYLYKDDNGRFNPIVWDLNMSFGTFGMTGSQGKGGNLNSTIDKAQLDHLLHDTDNNFPLLLKLLAVDRYKKMYLAHYKTILTENISNSNYLTLANDYQDIIEVSVQADTNKFYTNAQFTSNMTSDVNVGNNTAPGISSLMSSRNTYLSALADFTVTQPVISDVLPSNTSPEVGVNIQITANVLNANSEAVFLAYRSNDLEPFTKVLMYDDGTHNDGSANNGNYGAEITATEYIQYYIYAENDDIGAFSPAQAEHVFYSISATYSTLAVGDLVINEIMASNETAVADQDGDYDDWIELYNNSSQTVSLDNLYLSDDPDDLLIWEFPTGITIEPNNYLIIWCDKDEEQEGYHADLKFSASGENAILSYADGTIIETVTFGEQTDDMGYARNPNGIGDFVIQAPTYNANNQNELSVNDYELKKHLKVYPNPTRNMLTIENFVDPIKSIQVYNTHGQLLFDNNNLNDNSLELDFSSYAYGVYMVNVNRSHVLKIIRN